MAMKISEVIPVKLILHIKLTRFTHFSRTKTLLLFFVFPPVQCIYAQFTVHTTQIQSTVKQPVGASVQAFLFRDDQTPGKYLHINAG